MLHDTTFTRGLNQISTLNGRAQNLGPMQILELARQSTKTGRIALVSSFGAESVVLLHMVSRIDHKLPVLFIDTQMLFAETLTYQADVASQLGLSDIRIVRPDPVEVSEKDPAGALNARDKDACCALRKARPLQKGLESFDTWITGRKRFQSGTRAALEAFETDGDQRIKVNPLADWQPKDLQAYIDTNHLPRHPLLAHGFPSIGCAPCTSAIKDGEDARAGRWRNSSKTECGIHFVNGKPQVRTQNEGIES